MVYLLHCLISSPAASDGLESSFTGLKKKKKKPVSVLLIVPSKLLSSLVSLCFDDSVPRIVFV